MSEATGKSREGHDFSRAASELRVARFSACGEPLRADILPSS